MAAAGKESSAERAVAAREPIRVRFPPFRPRAPWWTGDLQTVRNSLVRASERSRAALAAWPTERLWIDAADGSGDRLAAAVQTPEGGAAREHTVIVLIHGLGGCEDSSYVQLAALGWLRRGHRVVRLNLRGAGVSRPVCRLQYDAGNTRDLRAALEALRNLWPDAGFGLVGFSLGGGLALRFASEAGSDLPLRAVASVSAPLDLAAASVRIHEPRNALYQRHILRQLKRQATAPGAALSPGERRAVERARTLLEFDEHFVAPRGGFAGAADYYARSSAAPRLAGIRIPALLLHAADDPWIPAAAYREAGSHPALPPGVRVLLAPGGGHVGFHGRGDATPWHQRCVERFFEGAPRAGPVEPRGTACSRDRGERSADA